jgi:hypothetical protein
MVSSMLGLIGVFATHIFDIYNCRTLVHVSWVLFGITYLGILALTYFFVPVGSIGQQFCTFYEGILTNQT